MPELLNTRTGIVLASELLIANCAWTRTRGLLGRSSIGEDEGLLIERCRMVHMMFMRFPIDVVFCAADRKVVAIQANLAPWRMSRYVPNADSVVELQAGKCARSDLSVGDQLEVR